MMTHTEDAPPLESFDQLIAYHASGERQPDAWKVGTEHEKFALYGDELRPLLYRGQQGAPGILTLLEAMERCCGWIPTRDNGEVIALASDDGSITLEPGGQVEMSGGAYTTVHETAAELRRHVEQLEFLSRELGVRWLWMGAQPVAGLDDIGWMPKRRYVIMRDYLPTRGKLARYMMQTTATVQANLDYGSEADMGRKMRMAQGLSSIVTAMFANSPLRGGKPSGYKSFRGHIWHHTDPDRTGLLRWTMEGDGTSYEQYVRYALDVPLFFIVRDGEYLNCAGLPFQTFWRDGFKGHRATMADWELHLSTLFPAVRLKTYIETRSADCVPPEYICALPAIWKALFYDDVALDAGWDLVKRWSFNQRLEHRAGVARHGLAAPAPRGHSTAELARELLEIVRFGLGRLAAAGGYDDESVYIAPITALVEQGRSPADEILDWVKATAPSNTELLEHYASAPRR